MGLLDENVLEQLDSESRDLLNMETFNAYSEYYHHTQLYHEDVCADSVMQPIHKGDWVIHYPAKGGPNIAIIDVPGNTRCKCLVYEGRFINGNYIKGIYKTSYSTNTIIKIDLSHLREAINGKDRG